MTDELKTKIDDSHEWLMDNFPFFYSSVLALGEPILDDTVATACVRVNDNDPRGWEYAVSPKMLAELSVEQFAVVMSHETLHIVFSHLKEAVSDKWSNKKALNIAHEILINDRLMDEGMDFPTGEYTPIFGPDVISGSASRMGTNEAYEAVLKTVDDDKDSENGGDDDSLGGGGAGDGGGSGHGHCMDVSMSPELAEDIANTIFQSMKDAVDDGEDESVSSALVEDLGLNDSGDMSTPKQGAGDGFSETVESAAARLDVSVAWMKILAEINPDVLKSGGGLPSSFVPDWSRSTNRYAHMRSKVILPRMVNKRVDKNARGFKGNSKPVIVLALDMSYSISPSWQEKLRSIAHTVPTDLIEVRCCTFSTQYVPFDISARNNRIASGGTDFSAIEDFIRQRVMTDNSNYPSSVVVFTDCQAFFRSSAPTKKQLDDSWTWVDIVNRDGAGFGAYYTVRDGRVSGGQVFNAREFIK